MRATFLIGGIVYNCLYQFHGFPGTMGASFIDYITTDMTTSTPEMAEQFDEYYLALPYSYMMSDHRLERWKLCNPMICSARDRSDRAGTCAKRFSTQLLLLASRGRGDPNALQNPVPAEID